MQTSERVERFKAEAADLKIKSSDSNRESLLQALGVVLMVVALVVVIVGYQSSLSASDSRDILSTIVLSVGMLILAVVGAALFVRYSIAKFLRFWLLRELYEGQEHLDRVVEAIERRDS